MKILRQVLIGVLILAPLFVSLFVTISPLPIEVMEAEKALVIARQTGDTNAEVESIQKILEIFSWRGDLWKSLGRLQLDEEQYSDAILSFQKADKLNQLGIDGSLWLADAMISAGESGEAKELLRQITDDKKTDVFTLLQTALLQRKIKDIYGAEATLLTAFELEPTNSEVNYQLGLQLAISHPDRAVEFLRSASQLNSQYSTLCGALINTIETTEEINSNAERQIFIGQIFSTYSVWDMAQYTFENATEIDPSNAIAWALLSESAQQNGQDGWEYLQKAQELNPDEEMVNGISGLYYRRQEKPELAIEYLNKALMVNPSAAVWEIEIGNTYANMGDLENALMHYQAGVSIDPENWSSLKALATFCITRNYEIETVGLPAAKKALELYPESSVLMDLTGTAYFLNGDYGNADAYFKRALLADPNQSAILIHLGQVSIEMEENEKAVEYLNQALMYAENDRARELAERLLRDAQGQ